MLELPAKRWRAQRDHLQRLVAADRSFVNDAPSSWAQCHQARKSTVKSLTSDGPTGLVTTSVFIYCLLDLKNAQPSNLQQINLILRMHSHCIGMMPALKNALPSVKWIMLALKNALPSSGECTAGDEVGLIPLNNGKENSVNKVRLKTLNCSPRQSSSGSTNHQKLGPVHTQIYFKKSTEHKLFSCCSLGCSHWSLSFFELRRSVSKLSKHDHDVKHTDWAVRVLKGVNSGVVVHWSAFLH